MFEQTRKQDGHFMARALFLARQGTYTTKPNPRVGCVLVKDKQIIAEGWHVRAGQGHAEIEALKNTQNAQGATVYVTLEPCFHYGRTPPCAEALINAGVARVVVAMKDPNPLVAGKGLALLEQADISVSCGVLDDEARLLNKGFVSRMLTGKPYVISKLAMSLDGRTAMASGESKWITSAQARQDVQKLRAASGAVLTGVDTVIADDPGMNVRMEGVDVEQPVRIILDSSLRTPVTARVLALEGRTVILTCSEEQNEMEALEGAGAEVYHLAADAKGRLDLAEVLGFLAEQQINDVLIEAGSVLNGALIEQGLIDECIIYMAPSILGSSGRGLFAMPNVSVMAEKKQLQFVDMRKIGMDLRLDYKVQK
ncbi:diaminohydroxyphosphoribosylaminopyrimidine deaminase/5-amino-6-(5-phosphoribosylamino)uracil reductase [Bathymodiolus platifrons methanotrophic gill symbiont]|uniref:bifunctional diaminohydroxyphosphoribosylaminopyrimidine deaminase/5-amino-6-(5-phosphoribosylamino)uracil reductase RibD n=1 Tax=Bathymodiolus platifrons methanotrophic gill symbiont TaxID=113268 RepID=UPI000B414A21|nr:bifunctional diaminohydroxyphosphoribosylaminopyrimidine deaminase/5-amino-6-(5-phosphoribosylamino)uracil reductase RibD [Bathymodiolus platifrons methanotrophic gill symbiont]MCK5870926.1 bifunctional diaminohydroxyphosphoribosylaminopyrimidine deaminase/5-amino-6-(5-phosphoribosylamino)uracil reductase RibD [Methyloprofundus sp.]TXK99285.1 riboflavin biosynthesis protein RibD [Methylococcaceae bacterium CS4]TXL00689.1 riboflavin biosynthesis protein RibD [Methylococcaceae bacterium CS5]TX